MKESIFSAPDILWPLEGGTDEDDWDCETFDQICWVFEAYGLPDVSERTDFYPPGRRSP